MTNDDTLYFYQSHVQRINPSGDNASALCPFHEDRNSSFSIHLPTGKYNCHGCDAKGNMLTFAQAKGIPIADVPGLEPRANGFNPDVRKSNKPPYKQKPFEIEKTYDYRDEMGALVFQEVRLKGKDFRFRRPDAEVKGKWIWNLKDVEKVLYRTPQLMEASERGVKVVYVVEGPKDVETLISGGM